MSTIEEAGRLTICVSLDEALAEACGNRVRTEDFRERTSDLASSVSWGKAALHQGRTRAQARLSYSGHRLRAALPGSAPAATAD